MDGEAGPVAELAALLREAADAHHRAFIETGGDDPEWPLWYAEFLHPRLGALLGPDLTKSELVFLLVAADRAHRRDAPDAEWAGFYAPRLLRRSG